MDFRTYQGYQEGLDYDIPPEIMNFDYDMGYQEGLGAMISYIKIAISCHI